MKISYPIRDKDGKEFRSLDEIMQLVDAEPHGTWLLGGNGLWHGAVHISEVSNPRSALTPDTLSTGNPVPPQFMADGTIVAYRINNDYLKGPYKGQELHYSSTFVLVKSQCQPDPKNEKSWLEFYSLYMHLAPVKDYPASCCYKVRDGHSGILLRKYTEGENGLPDGQEEGDAQQYKAPESAGRSLSEKARFVSSRTGRFYVTKRSGEATLTTFGLVRVVKDGKMEEKQYWVTLDPTLMEPDGEIQALMPAWMQKAKERSVFDSVQTVEETAEWKVSAGTPVGFMGCEEYPGRESAQAEREWFVHLEVLSADPRMPAFLGNPEGVKGEKRTVLAPKGRLLYTRQTTAGQETFTATSATLGAQCILPREATTPVTDESTQWWFNITGSGWLPEKDVAEAGQYDLLQLGFQPLVENSGGDMVRSPYEGWVPEAFDSVSRAAEQGDEWYEQVPPFYRELMAEMDSNHDGKVTEEEIRQALVVRDPLVRHVVNRLVIKHHSEWYGGRSTGRWEGFYKDLDTDEVAYCEKWQTDLEWMSGVSPFNTDEPVWHFHPIVFLEAIKGKSKITRQMLRRIWANPGNVSDSVLDVVAEEFSNKFEECSLNTKNRLYHFFAQIYQEVGPSFNLNEGFNYRPQVLIDKFSYYRNHSQNAQVDGYIPGRQAANKQNIANRAYGGREGNNDIDSGDGWRYRGRGMKQLTFRNNYRSFTVYHEKVWGEHIDFELNPDLLLETIYAARSALYFWDHNSLYSRADNGISRDVSDSITQIVNLYDNHYADRYNNLVRFIQDGVFDEIL
ncbi:chitinase [Citrobacter freundii complex sp. CFNIH9]|uniref:chitinase n=1 Tax=Citrobacter freundii complex sp. CFNIH9 TaxID=2077149 RepID=UPI001F26AF76|nr:chitinase [Citrobacter freundii complex sp. CFNIH9]